jgi:peptidylamidoglycolate lyase
MALHRIPRRQFLASSAALVAFPYLRLTAKAAPAFHNTTIGHGSFKYRVDKLWAKASPETHPVKDCHEMIQTADGRLFLLTNEARNNILIFDSNGNLLDSWTLRLSGAHGLTRHTDSAGAESLIITDTGGRVLKTDLQGNILLELPKPAAVGAYKEHEPFNPTETAVAPNGDIYVADGYGSQYILRYDGNGSFLSKFGGKSTQPSNPGKFMQAHGVAIDNRSGTPLLVCTERIRNEFNWFTLDGKHVRGVYLPGAYVSRAVIQGKHLYSGVCFGAKPDDYRMWQKRGFVTILDEDDRVVSCPGAHSPEYREGRLQLLLQSEPVFENCHDVCVDGAGDLYVCQWNSGKVYPYKLHREA